MWSQTYNPLHNIFLSTVVAAVPAVVLLGSIALLRIHFAALLGLGIAVLAASGAVIGCAALYAFKADAKAELACLAIEPDYHKGGLSGFRPAEVRAALAAY